MTHNEFRNALCIILNIDEDEYVAAGCDSELNPSSRWPAFNTDPFRTFLKMPDASRKALWAIVEQNQPGAK